jgi:hypothetical protein
MSASKRILKKLMLGSMLLALGTASAAEASQPAGNPNPGQMRGVTAAHRRAAAARILDRKVAAGQKNQAVQHPRHRKGR